MMAIRYLLDTDICIYIRRKRPPKILARFEKVEPGEVGISVVTYGELAYGVAKSAEPDRATSGLARLVALLPVLPLPEEAGKIYGTIRAALAPNGTLIGPNDLWISAHAMTSGLTVVTNNERAFSRVKGSRVENWAK
ncbi:MAG: tRNA(fMet)-specific endonuclease VapC [Alphaproteobacteria bacterium]|jgi:tRNA(fMet)-specific endonuclease VapC|nr:tRNA(fMet)-specific endonuclease VapC [Alphaproteobacteria bacterium]